MSGRLTISHATGLALFKARVLLTFALLAILVVYASSAHANSFKDGFNAYLTSDWHKAKDIFESIADKESGAAWMLGLMHQAGHPGAQLGKFEKNHKEAAKWYRIAAEKEHHFAQVALCKLYIDGLGVLQDAQQAIYWCRRSADRGFYQAQLVLGSIYFEGRVVAQNWSEATKWFQLAADQNSGLAQGYLGLIYSRGLGTQADGVKAYMYLNLAAASTYGTSADEQQFLDSIRKERDQLVARMSPWPAPGSEDTELGVFMGPEVRHGAAEVYARVQA